MSEWKEKDYSNGPDESMPEETSEERNENEDQIHPQVETLAKTQSSSRKSDIDPFSEPPDGGLNAWLKVLGCFLLYSNIW
jgi:hypothetical protein